MSKSLLSNTQKENIMSVFAEYLATYFGIAAQTAEAICACSMLILGMLIVVGIAIDSTINNPRKK